MNKATEREVLHQIPLHKISHVWQQLRRRSPLPTTRVVWRKNRSRRWSGRRKNSLMRTRRWRKGAVEKVTCHGLNLIHLVHYRNKGQLTPRQGGFVEYSIHSLDCCFNCSGARIGPDPKNEWLSCGWHAMRFVDVFSQFACHECASNGVTAAGWMRRMPLMVTSIPCVLPQRAPATTRVWVKRWTRRRRLGMGTSRWLYFP